MKKIIDPAEEGFKSTIWKQWQAWRKHLADNERRGRPNVHEGAPPIMDDNARLAFADWLADRGDPREAVVRGHVEPARDAETGRTFNFRNMGKHPETMHIGKLFHYDTIASDMPPMHNWNFDKDLIHPGQATENLGDGTGKDRALPSVVWRHGGITTSRAAGGSGRFREHPVMFHAPVTTEQYLAIADKQPAEKRKQWYAYAREKGWTQKVPIERMKLARLLVGAPTPKKTMGGDVLNQHPISDESGALVGHVTIAPRDDGRHLHVEWIGTNNNAPGAANSLGAEGMRSVLAGLVGHYPNAEYVSGKRVSGYRAATGEYGDRVVVPIRRLKLARHKDVKKLLNYWAFLNEHANDQDAHQPFDTNRAHVFADVMQEHGDPRAILLRAARAHYPWATTPKNAYQPSVEHPDAIPGDGAAMIMPASATGYRNQTQYNPVFSHQDSLSYVQLLAHHGTDEKGGYAFNPVLYWNQRIPAGLSNTKASRNVHFTAPVTTDQLHEYIDGLSPGKRAEWRNAAHANGWYRNLKLARPQVVTGRGAAVREQGSDNHQQRVALAQQVLREAGLRATVKTVLAHSGTSSRPAVAVQAVRASDPQHALFAAAWLGLLTQEPAVTVFSPGEGQDTLHVIDSPHPPDMVADYMRKVGVKQFTTEQRPTGTRVYAVNPDGNMATLAGGVHGKHSQFNGRADRIGGGSGSGAASGATLAASRAGYRTVIRDAERAAGFGSTPGPSPAA